MEEWVVGQCCRIHYFGRMWRKLQEAYHEIQPPINFTFEKEFLIAWRYLKGEKKRVAIRSIPLDPPH